MKKLVLLILFFSTFEASSQGKVNITGGLGYPELLNIGARFEYKRAQFGIALGTWPAEEIITVCGDVYYHFGKIPEWSDRGRWYGRL